MLPSSKTFALLLGAVTATCAKTAWSPDYCDDDQLLVDFQVAQPPPVPSDFRACTIMILERVFGNSYGEPEIVEYVPPTDCGEPGSWAAVTLNFTVTSKGAQYDRLGVFTFQNTEIWRTSTPEPTYNGIIWTYIKDVTRYIPLFSKPGPFILNLDNVLEDGLDGSYAATLHATFYTASQESPTANQSNLIIPISTMSSTSSGDASVPPIFSVNVTLPRNTVEIYAELFASGNAEEEFRYYNTATEFLKFLPPGTTYGTGSFREIRLLVDGQLAGIALPYPVIFSGGINPSMWRPITPYGALDLPTYFIDLTPFVPTFADGLPHNVTLDVASGESNHTVNQNWYVSGLLQVVTDPSGKPTTGGITNYDLPLGLYPLWDDFGVALSVDPGSYEDFGAYETAEHSLYIEAVVVSGSGQVNNVLFTQNLSYTCSGSFLNYAHIQNIAQVSSGSTLSLHNGVPAMIDNFEYTLDVNLAFLDNTSSCVGYSSWVNQSYNRQVLPAPFLLGSTIAENQQAAGNFSMSSKGDDSRNATNNNTFSYIDTEDNTYYRNVSAAHEMVAYDEQDGSLAASPVPWMSRENDVQSAFLARLPGGKSCECLV